MRINGKIEFNIGADFREKSEIKNKQERVMPLAINSPSR